MTAYLVSRLLQAALTLLVAVSLVFLAIRVVPGNPLLGKFGQHPDAVQIEKLRRDNGWDRPLVVQLGAFLWKLGTTGDLGESLMRGGSRVDRELRERFPATVELTFAALALAIPLGLAAGSIAALWPRRWPDRLAAAVSLVGVSVPVFFLGMILRAAFPGLPTSQRLPATAFDFEPLSGLMLVDTLLRGRFDLFLAAGRHLILPAAALATIPTATIARITRAALLDVMHEDYMRTARAKGAGVWRALVRHAFPNAAVPIANITGLQIGMLLSGAVLTETVFAWPGVGKWITDAVVNDRDYAVVQAGAIVVATLFVSLNLALDVLYVWLDPRVRATR